MVPSDCGKDLTWTVVDPGSRLGSLDGGLTWIKITDDTVWARMVAEAEAASKAMRSEQAALPGIIDFLNTKRSREELATALTVLREFKGCEGQEEWLSVPFAAWAKLEQLEEYLAHLADGAPLQEDTQRILDARKDARPDPC